ncbi:sensor domain-containing protein [Mycobacterium hubeiense]|uniref:sensor domain-containing protein n=1 Tax=Mycobacterium hubeiense TaxID=1867256 RepID=UPI00130404B0|nr:sensor domain-containing protein [Mycobacterium sp. QGD 101]
MAAVVIVAALGVFVFSGGDSSQQADAGTTAESAPTDTASSEPAAEPIPRSVMADGLLLSMPDAAKAIGVPTLVGSAAAGDKIYQKLASVSPIVDQDCSILAAAGDPSYEGSGWNDVRLQFLSTPRVEGQSTTLFDQAGVYFRNGAAAQKFLDATKAHWERCSNRSLNFRNTDDLNDVDSFFNVGPVSEDDGIIKITLTQEGGEGYACRRALKANNNLIIEMRVCGNNLPADVEAAVINPINEKIEAAH